MAKILKTNDQEKALETINATIKTLKGVNKYLETASAEAASTITVQTGKSKVSVDYETADAIRIMQEYAKACVAKVRTLSKKYVIGLDESDEDVLNAASGKKRAVKADPEPVEDEAAVEPADEEPAGTYQDYGWNR